MIKIGMFIGLIIIISMFFFVIDLILYEKKDFKNRKIKKIIYITRNNDKKYKEIKT